MLKPARLPDAIAETSDVITVEEAAERSGLSEQTIRRRCMSGEVIAEKVGGQWLISASDFKLSKPGRKRVQASHGSDFSYSRAVNHIRRTDLTELWVPDVLRYQDMLTDSSAIEVEAERRVGLGKFNPASPIPVPKRTYSNRPGVNLEMPDRVAFQAVVSSFASMLDKRLPDNVFSSRLSNDPKYFLAHGSKQFRKFKDAIPERLEDDPALEWIGSTDISSYFDNVLHGVLFEELSHAGVSGDALRTLRIMLSEWAIVSGMGLPQGPNASRVLGNFYLAQVDEEMSDDPNIVYLRYMDDVRIMAPTKVGAVAGLRKFEYLCRNRGLTLSSAKTSVDTIERYRQKDKDGHLDRIASLFDHNRISRSRPELRKLLKDSIGENSIDVRHARFSIWRLAKIREIGMLSRVLSRLELLAPVASPVASYLKPFINRGHVQRKISEFLGKPSESYSSFLRSWLYAAMLEAKVIPSEWRRIAEEDARDKNKPMFLRAVAVCVLGKARVPRDIAWLKAEARSDLDPEMVRALLVALTYGASLDKGTEGAVLKRHPDLQTTSAWLKGRVGLPSLVSPRQEIRVK